MPLDPIDNPKIIQGRCGQCGIFAIDLFFVKNKNERLCLSCFRLEHLKQLKSSVESGKKDQHE